MTNLLIRFNTFALIILLSVCGFACGNTCAGCLDLDDINFDKTIERFPYALIKFDIAFPYGEKHEAFAAFSRAAHATTDDILIGTVGIKDYGDNENKALGERFNIDDKNFPAIMLFRRGHDKPLPLPSHLDITLDNLKSFVSSNTDVYIGREGCLKQFNDLAKNFANLEDKQQDERIQECRMLKQGLTKDQDKNSAQIYEIFMIKIMTNGYKFVEDETKRLMRLKASKVAETKKAELKIKLNILEAFRVNKLTKEEL